MSDCNANFLLVSENIIINDSSEKLDKILKNAIENNFSTSLITDYIYYLIPMMIPFIGIILIPIFVYLFVNRLKFELPRSTNIIIFVIFNSFVICSVCFLFIYSYNFVLVLKNILCDTQRILIENFYSFSNLLKVFKSIECFDFPTIDLKSTVDQILDIIEAAKSYINIYYSLALVSLQVLLIPILLFTSTIFEKCKRKICFYSLFTIIITFSWILGCVFLPTSFVISNIYSISNNIFSNPSVYLEQNCIFENNGITITPCNMLTQCSRNSSRNLMIGLLNGSETDTYEDTLQRLLSTSRNNDNTEEQNRFIYNIISDETSVNTIEIITAENGTAQVSNVVNLLQDFRENTELYVAQKDLNATQIYIDNILEDVENFNGTITGEEFNKIISNSTNIPQQFENRTFEDIITLKFSSRRRRRRLSESLSFGDTSDFICISRLLSRLSNTNIQCSSITQIKKMNLPILSNSSFLYFVFSLITCILSFIILPFFTEAGKGRPIKLPQIKYSIK
jgi:hypothetical protein